MGAPRDDELLRRFEAAMGPRISFSVSPRLALCLLAASRYAVGDPGLSLHVSDAVWHWSVQVAEAFEKEVPGITHVHDWTSPALSAPWEHN